MEEVKEEWKNNCFTEEGAYIAPSVIANKKNYIKKTINIQMGNSIFENIDNKNSLPKNNKEIFSVYPNPIIDHATVSFSLNESKEVSLRIFDLNGKLRMYIIENTIYNKGNHEIPIYLSNLEKGVYICKLVSGKNVYNRKILIK